MTPQTHVKKPLCYEWGPPFPWKEGAPSATSTRTSIEFAGFHSMVFPCFDGCQHLLFKDLHPPICNSLSKAFDPREWQMSKDKLGLFLRVFFGWTSHHLPFFRWLSEVERIRLSPNKTQAIFLKFTIGKSTKGVKCSGAMLARRLLLVSGRIVKHL